MFPGILFVLKCPQGTLWQTLILLGKLYDNKKSEHSNYTEDNIDLAFTEGNETTMP
jgi:hypothetical protein